MERLAVGPVIGDGGFVFALEKRGYVKVRPKILNTRRKIINNIPTLMLRAQYYQENHEDTM